jgi:hypothetical protein
MPGADQLPYLDLQLEIDNGRRLITKLYDKLEDSTITLALCPENHCTGHKLWNNL